MAFKSFFHQPKKKRKTKGPRNVKSLRASTKEEMNRQGCLVCPLDRARLKHGKMEPTGPEDTDIYVLGEAPGEDEDKEGEQFVGVAGKIIRGAIRKSLEDNYADEDVRWNNSIRCHPPRNRNPSISEIECCRKYIIADIENVKPYGVIGTGNIPLKHYVGLDTISNWRGLRIPVKFGDHVCWYFPIFHPSYINYNSKINKRTGKKIVTELDMVFQRDIDRVFKWLEEGKEPEYLGDYTKEQHLEGMQWVFGEGQSDFRKVEKWLDRMSDKPRIGFDWETTHIRPYSEGSRILSLGVATDKEGYAFPCNHPKAWSPRYRKMIMDLVREFTLHSGRKIAHYLEFEQEWAAYHLSEEVLYQTKWDDTYAYSFALDGRKYIHSLDNLCFRYYGFWLKAFSNVNRAKMIEEPLEKVLPYNALDAKYTYKLRGKLREEIKSPGNEGLLFVAEELVRVAPAIVTTQLEGIYPNWEAYDEFKDEFKKAHDDIEKKLFRLPEVKQFIKEHGEYTPLSNPNIKTIMKDILNRKEGYPKKQDGSYDFKGKYSVDEDALKEVPESVTKFPRLTLDFRQNNKLDSTYCGALEKFVFPDGKIHCSYKTKWVSTLRTACEDPNMQNWPKKRRKDLRRMIKAPKGFLLYCFDYGQIQARAIAMMSKDPSYCDSMWHGLDVHRKWAENLYDMYPVVMDKMLKQYDENPKTVEEEKAWSVLRDAMKNRWVFPLFFGSSKGSCQHNLQLTDRVVGDLYDWFWDEYSGVHDWHKDLREFYKQNGYVASLGGSRRREPMGMNELINSPIQGVERDIVLDAWCRTTEEGHRSVLEVHDDLSFHLPDDKEGEEVAEEIAEIMCLPDFDWVNVPISLEVTRGETWYDLEDYKEYSSEDYGHTKDNTTAELLR